jgi:signal transduction histidine kinase
MRLFEEADQQLNRTLARDMAVLFEPYLRDSIDTGGISRIIERLEGLNRRIEIHLLASNGMVKASFLKRELPLVTPTVDLEPVTRWMAGADPPVLGSDPLSPGVCKPFSVAPVTIMGETGCYLYIILGGMRFDSAAAMIQNSYILRGSLAGGALILLATALAGLLLLALLTRRLRVMTHAVGEFEQGRFDARVPEASGDELGRLGRGFNRMADTIVATLDRLRRADEQRRELVANVSHDLRNPLAMLQGYLETLLIKEDTLGPGERRHYTEIGLVSARRLSGLVEQLFELSRLDAQEIQPGPEAFPLQELAQDLVLQMLPRAAAKGMELTMDHGDALPEVRADIAMIERAVANLLDNALKHTPAGGKVALALSRTPGGVRLEVRDTGPGIPAGELSRIFERFYRVEKSRVDSSGADGAGLGLAIARRLIDLCGGRLEVESTPGQGSCFHFTLPIAGAPPVPSGDVTLS